MPNLPRRVDSASIDTWSIPCFGGPLHGDRHDVEDNEQSFDHAYVPGGSLNYRESNLQRALRIERCRYQVVEHRFEGPGCSRRIKTAIFDGPLTLSELLEYRQTVHDEYDDFRQDNASAVDRSWRQYLAG